MTTQYNILTALDAHHLAIKVQSEINQGWTPIGGVAVAFMGGTSCYAQAVTFTPVSVEIVKGNTE